MGVPDRANQTVSDSIAVSSEAGSPLVQRACACGNVAKVANSCGTCEVSQRFGAPALQRKVALGAPDDRFEQEADRVAEQVVGMAAPDGTEEAGSPGPSPADEETLQTKSTGGALEAASTAEAVTAVASGGRPLSAPERAYFEPRFGRDFSTVRIHEHRRAAVAADGIKARAFTLGRDIGFAAGAYRPGSDTGRKLMAHELTHTLQQTGLVCARPGRSPLTPAQIAAPQIQRAPPESDEDVLGQYMTYIEDGHAKEVKQSDLVKLGDYELTRLKDYAKTKRGRLLRQAETASNEYSKKTFESEARNVYFVIRSILDILIRRGRARESTEFKEIANKVRGELSGDQLCIYEKVLPLIPKFLEGLLKGQKVPPGKLDRVFGGYISKWTARSLMGDPVTDQRLLDNMTVLPRNLAAVFHRAGHDTSPIVKAMQEEFDNINAGVREVIFLKNKLGSGASHSEPPVQLAHKLEEMVTIHSSLYACIPQIGDATLGGQTDDDRERQAGEHESATDVADSKLEDLPAELVPKHKVKVLGLEPED